MDGWEFSDATLSKTAMVARQTRILGSADSLLQATHLLNAQRRRRPRARRGCARFPPARSTSVSSRAVTVTSLFTGGVTAAASKEWYLDADVQVSGAREGALTQKPSKENGSAVANGASTPTLEPSPSILISNEDAGNPLNV